MSQGKSNKRETNFVATVILTINSQRIEAQAGVSILEAARMAGISTAAVVGQFIVDLEVFRDA
jgi:hypothetical protein